MGQGDAGSLSEHSHGTLAVVVVGDVVVGGVVGPQCGVTCCVLKVEMLHSSSFQRLVGPERRSQPSPHQHSQARPQASLGGKSDPGALIMILYHFISDIDREDDISQH